MNTLTDRIRTAREEAGLSQTDVARALRISASAVNQWEHGFSKNIKLPTFFALARLLGQDPHWLATGKALSGMRGSAAMPPAPDFPTPTGEDERCCTMFANCPLPYEECCCVSCAGCAMSMFRLIKASDEVGARLVPVFGTRLSRSVGWGEGGPLTSTPGSSPGQA